MVRGFGMTLGRKAANAVTRPSVQTSNKQSKFEREREIQILKHQEGIKKYNEILSDAQQSYKDNKITEIEFRILKSQIDEGIADQEAMIAKLQGVKESKGSVWGFLFFLFIVVPILIGIFS